MLSILKDIPSFALSCELDDFIIMTDKTVTIEFSHDGRVLFASNYVPDANREIHFRDLCSVIDTYLEDDPLKSFRYRVSAPAEQPVEKSFDVLLCRFDVSETGATFVQNHFLTSLMGRKSVGYDSTEFLYAVAPSATTALSDAVYVQCVYATLSDTVVTEQRTISRGGAQGINKFDVSPSQFAKDDMTLIRYTVSCGSRKVRYDVHERHSDATIRFKNNFGCVETYAFAGLVEINPKFERSAALVNGHRVNYDVREDVHYKCYSSYIPPEMFFFADDIAASDHVTFVVGGQQFPVAVVESETPRTNSSSALNSFWVEFVAASKRGFRVPELTRIFDDTFDATYN